MTLGQTAAEKLSERWNLSPDKLPEIAKIIDDLIQPLTAEVERLTKERDEASAVNGLAWNKRGQLDTPFLDRLLDWKREGDEYSNLETLLIEAATELRSLRVAAEQRNYFYTEYKRFFALARGGDGCDEMKAVFDQLESERDQLRSSLAKAQEERDEAIQRADGFMDSAKKQAAIGETLIALIFKHRWDGNGGSVLTSAIAQWDTLIRDLKDKPNQLLAERDQLQAQNERLREALESVWRDLRTATSVHNNPEAWKIVEQALSTPATSRFDPNCPACHGSGWAELSGSYDEGGKTYPCSCKKLSRSRPVSKPQPVAEFEAWFVGNQECHGDLRDEYQKAWLAATAAQVAKTQPVIEACEKALELSSSCNYCEQCRNRAKSALALIRELKVEK